MTRSISPKRIEQLLRAVPPGCVLAIGVTVEGEKMLMQVLTVQPGSRFEVRPMQQFHVNPAADIVEMAELNAWGYWYVPKAEWKPKPLFTDVEAGPAEDPGFG